MTSKTDTPANSASTALRAALWIAQVLVAASSVIFGFMKATVPIAELAGLMAWVAEAPEALVRTLGVVDTVVGIGILLPALLRFRPGLTIAAALVCAALQAHSILFHLSRGEAEATPYSFVIMALALFVFWGRWRKAPIAPRA